MNDIFYYFKNKKEYYLFLVEQAIDITRTYLEKHSCYGGKDIFEVIQRGMDKK